MSATEHHIRIHKRYRFDLAAPKALWTIDGTVKAVFTRRKEWLVIVTDYRGTVTLHDNKGDREMTVVGDSIELPLELIIHTEEISQ